MEFGENGFGRTSGRENEKEVESWARNRNVFIWTKKKMFKVAMFSVVRKISRSQVITRADFLFAFYTRLLKMQI